MSIYDFEALGIDGTSVPLSRYRGQVLLIVNTASACVFTPQLAGLQVLHDRYAHQGLVVLGFPCNQFGGQEPGSADEIATFCSRNHGVSFPLMAKVNVNGPHAHPLFTYLRQQAPGVEPKLVPGVSLNLLSQVDAGEVDLAIMIKPPFELPKELSAQVIRREPFVLIVPPDVEGDDPLQLLAEHPHVRYDRNSFGGRLVTRFLREQRIDVHVALELDELEAIVKMVECGLGVSLLPRAGLWLEHPLKVRVIELGEVTFYREMVVLQRYSQRSLPIHKLFAICLECE